jgi:hypothetical protein
MRVIIQCASRKRPGAQNLLTADGRRVVFVARPDAVPQQVGVVYARPDDDSGDGRSWREQLLAYNAAAKVNPLGLLPAYQLYAHTVYDALAESFGVKSLFILSAGWGLIPATFLTPYYDITFSASAEPWKRRRREDPYEDLRLIRDDGDDIVFLGGKDYLPLFCHLTASLQGRKTVFFNSSDCLDLPAGFAPVRYRTRTRTNWHYECASVLAAGGLRDISK